MKRVVMGLALVALVALAATAVVGWAWSESRPVEGSSTQVFRITPGESLTKVAQRLAEERLVRNALLFRLWFQWGAGDGGLPSGTFAVPRGLTAGDLATYFRSAQPLQIKVTIPEGWTSTKIARLLEDKGVVSASDFLSVVRNPVRLGSNEPSLEGQLFPDTYLFPVDAGADAVVRTLVETFRAKTARWRQGLSDEEWHARVVLASIVEREYRVENEAPVIASVFLNRLDQGIPLGSCATIEYILTEVQGRPHPRRIFFVHTQIPSPFNTYIHKGLPPAPIANPGLTALRAAFEPASTKYLYFVVADAAQGTHTFSSNWGQHEKAREVYLNSFVTKG